MRILFSFIGGYGHFLPLLPIANAAASAGHTVAFACGYSIADAVRSTGFETIFLGQPSNAPPGRKPLLPVDIQREERDMADKFARRAGHSKAAQMLLVCEDWQPDVVVCDEVDFGTMIACERLGVPYATVTVLAAGNFARSDVIAEPLADVRTSFDLPPDEAMTMLNRYLSLVPVPRSFRDPAFPLPPTAHLIRPMTVSPTNAPAPFPIHDATVPTVYVTLGTVFNVESGDLFSRVLQGLHDLPVNVVMTVGNRVPAAFGSPPGNVHIAQFIPQETLLPHCDLVISHGGSGSVIAALAHGLPMLVIAMGADQPHNAVRCEALGVARSLDPIAVTPAVIREAVQEVMGNPHYREAANVARDEIAAMPDPASAVPLLQRLARTRMMS